MALTATIGSSGAPHVDVAGTVGGYVAPLQRTVDGVTETLTATGQMWDGNAYTDWVPPPGRVITYLCGGETATVTMPTSSTTWLVDASRPELSVPVTVRYADSYTISSQREIVDIPNRDDLVVISISPRKSRSGVLELVEEDRAQREAINAILKSNRPLWLSMAICGEDDGLPSQWLSFGDVEWSRRSPFAIDQERFVAMPYVQVGRPAPVPVITRLRIRDLDMPIDSINVPIDSL